MYSLHTHTHMDSNLTLSPTHLEEHYTTHGVIKCKDLFDQIAINYS